MPNFRKFLGVVKAGRMLHTYIHTYKHTYIHTYIQYERITNVKTEATRQEEKREKAKKEGEGGVNHEYNLFKASLSAN